MIFFIIVFALLALFASLGWMHTEKKLKVAQASSNQFENQWLSEQEVSCALRNEKRHEWVRANIAEEKVVSMGLELAELRVKKQHFDAEVPDKAIRNRYPRKPTSMDYYELFEAHPIGRDVLDDLVNIFGGATYVRGGHDADRETCFKAGKKFVVDHILIQVSKATETKQDKSEVMIDDN